MNTEDKTVESKSERPAVEHGLVDRSPQKAGFFPNGWSSLRSASQGLARVKGLFRGIWSRLRKPDHAKLTIEGPRGLPRLAEYLSGVRTITTDFVLVVIVLLLIWAVLREINEDVVLIEPFALSPELVMKGYTPESVSSMIATQIDIITAKANTAAKKQGIALSSGERLPDIEIPEAHVTFKSIIRYIKGRFGFNPTQVEGEAMLQGTDLHWVVRVTKKGVDRAQSDITVIINKVESSGDATLEAAKHIIKNVEPYILASYFYENHDEESALVLVQYCLDHDPRDDSWAYNLWGLILYDRGDCDGAIEKYREAVDKYPGKKFAVAYSNWALASMRKGDFKEAEEKCKKAVDLDPKSPSAYNAWGLVKEGQKMWDEAEALFHAAVKSSPGFPLAYNNWGNMLSDRGDYLGAKIKYRLAVEVNPGYSDAYNNLGNALEKLDDIEGAALMYRKASELDPVAFFSSINLGDVLTSQPDGTKPLGFDGAIASYNQALERISKFKFTEELNCNANLSTTEVSIQDPGERKKWWLARVYSKLGDVWLKKNDLKRARENIEKAAESLQKARDLDPKIELSAKAKDFIENSPKAKPHSATR